MHHRRASVICPFWRLVSASQKHAPVDATVASEDEASSNIRLRHSSTSARLPISADSIMFDVWAASYDRPGLQQTTYRPIHDAMLDRLGGEVARAPSIVRYASGSRFDRHTHGGGEEILVLEGTQSDERGDYSAGSFVLNPAGSVHSVWSRDGCVVLIQWDRPVEFVKDQT